MGKSSKAEIRGGEPLATDYEVFLNFRGPDTRQGFTDCLYHGMLDANICVFFDKEELHIGKEIGNELSTAIKKSKIYIPIFSKGYASSAWCLHELAHMVECKKSKPSEKEILPIFYDVEPRDVKLKSELYVSALVKHEDMFGRQRRLKWEDALRSVAQIKGWELKNQGYWKFIKSVIQEIVMKLKTKDKYVAEHIVGMDEQVEAVVELLDVDSKVMRFVLIHGMGGIGKTTLTKVAFNKLNSLFSHCCFLGNVQELSLRFGLMTLQKQLLSDIFGSGFRDVINDVDDGIKMIAQRLSNKKVFIVLDDVGNEEQLEKLAIKHISFNLGSKIIITTRNKSILKAYQTLEYEVKPLDYVQSLELFCRRAFKRNFLQMIICIEPSKEIPYEKVQDKLKIGYNVLSHEQKQIFLDIACMFVDKDKTNASYMWKDCRFFPEYSIQVLVCMSLIKITDDNKFWMHDQLRDLGRKIVCGDTGLRNLGRQSRLSCPDMAKNIIRTKEVQQ
ncbi:TMV resistance protein N-like [Eucalyptus grandis]|uniref:TMV resistance protein N-like n=1 Tax=Eucalyptus grandis TaxID=71139 RepID=UPI00192EA3C1|nr:TMV resistance protein N-like [Eucalyptus grandis]